MSVSNDHCPPATERWPARSRRVALGVPRVAPSYYYIAAEVDLLRIVTVGGDFDVGAVVFRVAQHRSAMGPLAHGPGVVPSPKATEGVRRPSGRGANGGDAITLPRDRSSARTRRTAVG